jgi:predicted transcriptional regulator YheO
VRIVNSEVSLRNIENTISEKNRLEQMLDKTTDALRVYFEELKKIKKALLSAMTPLNAS